MHPFHHLKTQTSQKQLLRDSPKAPGVTATIIFHQHSLINNIEKIKTKGPSANPREQHEKSVNQHAMLH